MKINQLGAPSLTWKHRNHLRKFTLNLEKSRLIWKFTCSFGIEFWFPKYFVSFQVKREVYKLEILFPSWNWCFQVQSIVSKIIAFFQDNFRFQVNNRISKFTVSLFLSYVSKLTNIKTTDFGIEMGPLNPAWVLITLRSLSVTFKWHTNEFIGIPCHSELY